MHWLNGFWALTVQKLQFLECSSVVARLPGIYVCKSLGSITSSVDCQTDRLTDFITSMDKRKEIWTRDLKTLHDMYPIFLRSPSSK